MSLSFRSLVVAITVAISSFASSARADIMQPNGDVIPMGLGGGTLCNSNLQICLDQSEVMLGGMNGAVHAVHNATIDQETFDPKCQLTFKMISKGGSVYGHAFGWYPAKPGNTPPALRDLHVFLTCQDCQTIGTTKTLTVPAGTGAIGFFTASYTGTCAAPNADGTLAVEPTYTMYTERRFNGRLRNGNPDPASLPNFIRALIWQSAARPDSFYFGWEDDGSQYSDQNFNDLVTLVSGIECSSGGQACDTGQKGFCAHGTMQCRAGTLTCVPDRMPGPEKCNAVDDNCDGVVDEGNPCPTGFVCFRGNCVPNCARGEFSCAGGTACEADAGVCVDVACRNVTCPAGQVCRTGACVGECLGVKCPYGQACQGGGCVDVCSALKCDDGFVCTPSYAGGADKDPVGVCSNCGCQGCSAGTTCSNMHCVPNDCASVMCIAGTHCAAGMCVDDCAGALCPPTQKCDKGKCVPDSAIVDAGRESGPVVIMTSGVATGSGVSTGTGTGTGTGQTGGRGATTTTTTTTTTGAGGGGGSSGNRGNTDDKASCGCRVPGGRAPQGIAILFSLLALATFARRRAR